MEGNADFSNQFNLLNQSNNPVQTNPVPLYNPNLTATNNGLTGNMFAWDQSYLHPLAPIMNIATNPTFGNNFPVFMPPESLPSSYYITNDNNSHVPLQDPTNLHPLDPNWEAINAFLAGHVRPGADVSRVFRCGVCNVEFANPQALGGHMSSHSKVRKKKEMVKSTKPKKFKKSENKKVKKTKSFVKCSLKNDDVKGLV